MKNFKELALESKAWPVVEARKILDRVTKSGNKSINLQTGYGPSGLPHIGTFGEVARTTMIYNALKNLTDLEINLLTFSDDLDGLRKVPDNIPNTKPLEENLNKPLTSIPDPFGTHPSFGEHNNAMLRDFLDKFEFNYEFKSATNLYKSGFFDEQLINVLRNHDKIKNIVLPTLGADRQKTYSPFLPICPDTNKVLEVEILETKLDNNSITYKHNDKLYEVPVTGGHCKLQWKVDWAMRWIALGIDYEMYGKDLIPTFQLSAKICRALGGNPPENYFYEFESALASDQFKDPENGFRKYIDEDSFIDYFILNELSNNVDGFRLSTYLHKDRDKKLMIGPIWDFNLSFGNANYCGGERYDIWLHRFNERCLDDFWNVPFWWKRLLEDQKFVEKLKKRWNELRLNTLSNVNIVQMINNYYTFLNIETDIIKKNFDKWKILGVYIWPNSFIGNSYDQEINFLKIWIENRLNWLDSSINNL